MSISGFYINVHTWLHIGRKRNKHTHRERERAESEIWGSGSLSTILTQCECKSNYYLGLSKSHLMYSWNIISENISNYTYDLFCPSSSPSQVAGSREFQWATIKRALSLLASTKPPTKQLTGSLRCPRTNYFYSAFSQLLILQSLFLLVVHAFLHASKSSCLFENPITISHCVHGQNRNSLNDPTSSSLPFPSAQTSFPSTFLYAYFAPAWALADLSTKQAHTVLWAVPLIEKNSLLPHT